MQKASVYAWFCIFLHQAFHLPPELFCRWIYVVVDCFFLTILMNLDISAIPVYCQSPIEPNSAWTINTCHPWIVSFGFLNWKSLLMVLKFWLFGLVCTIGMTALPLVLAASDLCLNCDSSRRDWKSMVPAIPAGIFPYSYVEPLDLVVPGFLSNMVANLLASTPKIKICILAPKWF